MKRTLKNRDVSMRILEAITDAVRSHETDLEDAADHILRVKKEEGESFVVNS